MIRAWLAEGKPKGQQSLGSYESWSEIMGGILDVAKIPGFLANSERVYEDADQESNIWAEFCKQWWKEFGDQIAKAEQLFGLATRHRLLLEIWADHTDQAGRIRFGQALGKMRDRVIGEFRISLASDDAHSKVRRYRLIKLRGVAGSLEGQISSHPDSHSPGSTTNELAENGLLDSPQLPALPATAGPDPWDEYLEGEDGAC